MDSSIWFMVLLQVVLIGLNAIFACAEIAVISMNDTKLAKMASEGDKRAVRLARLTSQPARFLATIQVAITLSGFMGSAFAAENFSGVLVDAAVKLGVPIPASVLDSIAVVLITIVLSYFTLVFGELVPKQVAMRKAEPLALGMSGLISSIAAVFAPIVSFLTISTNGVLRLLHINPDAEEENVSEEEIRMMVDVGSEKGTIDSTEREFIQNVFEFDDLSAEDIATRRKDVAMLDLEDSMEVWKETIHSTRFNFYPVCEESADRIVGILNAKDYFRLEDQSRESVLEHAVSEAYFVPNMVKADTLFRNMKKEHQRMAVVLDEYGGLIGIVTINDLVEKLVGDLGTEEEEEKLIELIGPEIWRIQGGASLEEVSEKLNIHLSSEEFGTFNGFVFDALGRVPTKEDKVEFEQAGLLVRIIETRRHQVVAVVRKVVKPKEDSAQEEE